MWYALLHPKGHLVPAIDEVGEPVLAYASLEDAKQGLITQIKMYNLPADTKVVPLATPTDIQPPLTFSDLTTWALAISPSAVVEADDAERWSALHRSISRSGQLVIYTGLKEVTGEDNLIAFE